MSLGIYRSMLKGADGSPKIGPTANELGVRPPDGVKKCDVDLCPTRKTVVLANGKGMSVASSWRKLPLHRIPKRLEKQAKGATGRNDCSCFKLADFEYKDFDITESLKHTAGKSAHGLIHPVSEINIVDLQGELAATQKMWSVDEK
jgi:hypothetical protein